jgi:hypothetical protein
MNFSDLCGFTEKQWTATEAADTHRYMLFGGSRGPGKSYWLRWYLLRGLLQFGAMGIKNVDVMLACEDYPSLTGRQVSKIITEFPTWLGEVRDTKRKGLGFHLRPAYGGGSILLRNLDDPSRYQSFEFAKIGIDELTKNPLETFNTLRGSLRWPGVERTQIVGATNPAANWVRDLWISGDFPPGMEPLKPEFKFVSALPTDNPHLDSSYWQNELSTLTGALREAWLNGDWFAGVEGLVYETFTAENETSDEPDPDLPFEIAIDDGYFPDPRATLFIQRQPNQILVFDEMYQYKTLEETTVGQIATHARWGKEAWKLPELAVASHEAPALRTRLRLANIPARNWLTRPINPSEKGSNNSKRVAAIKKTRGLFLDGNGYRCIKINRRCRHLLDEIKAGYKYPEGKHSVDDKPEDGNDHACNALESWIWMRV